MMLPALKEISIYRHLLHFKQPAGTSRGVYLTRKLWLVALSTDSYTAVGECAPLPDLSCDALPDEQFEKLLGEFCSELFKLSRVGLEGALDGKLEREHLKVADAQGLKQILPEPLHSKLQDYPSMRFALESALLELLAQSVVFSNSPFTKGQGIPINGLIWMGDFEQMFARLKDKMAQGFRCIKLKIGAIDFEQELALLSHIREHFSPEQIEIRVDANGAFKPEDAPYKLERLSKFVLHSIEQPIKAGQWPAMRKLCESTPLPIALDEELIGVNTLAQKIELLDTIHPQYIILKPSLHGGISGALEWIELAKARHMGYWITSALESNIGLNVIAQLSGLLHPTMPQGLGTGQLFTDNIEYPLSIQKDALYLDTVQELSSPPLVLEYLKQHQATRVSVIA